MRSKLAMARIMGNKATEKELRSKNFGGLHTDIVAEEDYGFLAKLEHRPCTAKQYTPPHREISRDRDKTISRQTSTDQISHQSQARRSVPGTLVRASTTIGTMNETTKNNNQSSGKGNQQSIKTQTVEFVAEKSPNKTDNECINKSTKAQSLDKARPKTVTIVTHTPEVTPLPSPMQYSRRNSKAADFFEEDKKIDIVGLRLKAARSLDYTDRVLQFCEELEDMASGHPQTDWYSMRLHSTVEETPDKRILNGPQIIDEGDKRAIGNVNVRSLTLPQPDWNFQNA